MDLPEEEKMWKEKREMEITVDETNEPFIPAKLVDKDDRHPLVHVDL
jgi:hypothetical protein